LIINNMSKIDPLSYSLGDKALTSHGDPLLYLQKIKVSSQNDLKGGSERAKVLRTLGIYP